MRKKGQDREELQESQCDGSFYHEYKATALHVEHVEHLRALPSSSFARYFTCNRSFTPPNKPVG